MAEMVNESKTRPIITIDQGNSSTKTCVVADGVVIESIRTETPSLDAIVELIDRIEIGGMIYCSVSRLDARFVESLSRLIPEPVILFTHSTPLPIKIEYKSPQTLGLDRIAAAVSAAALQDGIPALVVDAGSAITLDVVDKDAVFRGGNIAPGILMRFRALHNFTGKLPLVSSAGPLPEIGFDTATAIRVGVMRGVAAEIYAAFDVARRLYGADKIILTGGDADAILNAFDNYKVQVNVVPDMNALGLERIFRYNENIQNENN